MVKREARTRPMCGGLGKGYVKRIDAMDVAVAVHKLGGGRNSPGEAINWAVGVQLLVDIGDQVQKGQPWVRIHHDATASEEVLCRLSQALEVSNDPVTRCGSRLQTVVREG